MMSHRVYVRGLWACTIAILAISGFQALSGHWVALFLFWPGFQSLGKYMGLLNSLASLHRVFGFLTGGLSVVTLVFALLARPRMLVRLSSIVGLGVVGLAVIGGILYVTSVFKDRWSLGQMADAFVGVFAVYFVQLLLMTISSRTQRAVAAGQRE